MEVGGDSLRADVDGPEGDDLSTGDWLAAARRRAASRFREAGLPKRRDEYWKYTDPGQFHGGGAGGRQATAGSARVEGNGATATIRNGRLSEMPDPESGVPEIVSLGDAADSAAHWGQSLYGELEAGAQQVVSRGLAALNTRDAEGGAVVSTTPGTKQSLRLHHESDGAGNEGFIHHLIRVMPGSELQLLESGSAGQRSNVVIEVDVMEGARFSHMRLQNRQMGRRSIDHVFARVGQRAKFSLFTLSADHDMVRNECVVELAGEGGEAHVSGAVVGGSGSHHDDTVMVVHDAADCRSRQVFKKVLLGGAVGVFQGKILVRDKAQRTDGYQISKGMLLGETSQFLAKPELEIYADDVACSHGSTSGNADADSLFYLRARGIPEKEAMNLLALAFLAETLEEISDSSDVEMIRQMMIRHLAELSNAVSG